MALRDWIQNFQQLHDRARKNELADPELREYQREREELAATLLAAQKLDLKAGQAARQSLRVPLSLPIEITIGGSTWRASTIDISVGGFATILRHGPSAGEFANVTLFIPDNRGSLPVTALVGGVQRQGPLYRTSFIFGRLSLEAKERLAFLVFDTVLETLGSSRPLFRCGKFRAPERLYWF
jgi:PilZ domain